jgi:hypothetical protein
VTVKEERKGGDVRKRYGDGVYATNISLHSLTPQSFYMPGEQYSCDEMPQTGKFHKTKEVVMKAGQNAALPSNGFGKYIKHNWGKVVTTTVLATSIFFNIGCKNDSMNGGQAEKSPKAVAQADVTAVATAKTVKKSEAEKTETERLREILKNFKPIKLKVTPATDLKKETLIGPKLEGKPEPLPELPPKVKK